LRHFENNCRRFRAAFGNIYPKTRIGYSYKTNYLPHFIRRAHAAGAYAEVVSRFELDLAQKMGVPGGQIIFNGPIKQPQDLLHAADIGAKVNIDSTVELRHLLALARKLPSRTPVGIRCFLGENTPASRFGLDLLTPEGESLLNAIDNSSSLYLAGLHCHHSGSRTVERYRARTQALISIHRTLLNNKPLAYIDIGGGFASPMSARLAAQMAGPVPTFDDYADAVAGEMCSAYGDNGPELILEPGMALLADSMVFVTKVEALKHLNDRQFAVVHGSMLNIKPLRGSVNLPISVIPVSLQQGRLQGVWDIVGSTCMEIDTLHEGYAGDLAEGDFILVENVGAYSTVLSPPFIRGTPAVLELGDTMPGRTLKATSTPDELLAMYEAAQ
jgi:diaminopimelate decarboxylase